MWMKMFSKHVEAIVSEDNNMHKEQRLSKDKLTSLFDCIRWANNESYWNWYNYWPIVKINGKDNFRAPKEVHDDIFFGKLIEFIFAMQHRDEIDIWPTVYSKDAFEEYDLVFKNRDKYDVKSSREAAEMYKKKFPHVKVAYPKDKENLENMEFVVI